MSLQRSLSDALRSWYPTSSYAVHFKCVLSFGEPQQATDYALDNAMGEIALYPDEAVSGRDLRTVYSVPDSRSEEIRSFPSHSRK